MGPRLFAPFNNTPSPTIFVGGYPDTAGIAERTFPPLLSCLLLPSVGSGAGTSRPASGRTRLAPGWRATTCPMRGWCRSDAPGTRSTSSLTVSEYRVIFSAPSTYLLCPFTGLLDLPCGRTALRLVVIPGFGYKVPRDPFCWRDSDPSMRCALAFSSARGGPVKALLLCRACTGGTYPSRRFTPTRCFVVARDHGTHSLTNNARRILKFRRRLSLPCFLVCLEC